MVPDELDELVRHPKAARSGEPMRSHNKSCFGCGAESPRGLHLAVYAGDGFSVDAQMPIDQWMEGGPGVIHGGILSTALDDVMGMLPRLLGPPGVTVHLQVDFLQPVPVGKTLHIHASVLGKQRRKIYTEATAHLGDPARPVARGNGVFVTINAREHFADHVENSAKAEEYRARMERP
ncbi:thioesterase superfamily protein [Gordonia sp. KTR9]|nr:thioesterase superfamily protein [Gordonia sp. KTR9]